LGRDAHMDLLQACLTPRWASILLPLCCYVCWFLLDWNISKWHITGILRILMILQ
jgi:hypothetical protein